jgi:hypothetical protein
VLQEIEGSLPTAQDLELTAGRHETACDQLPELAAADDEHAMAVGDRNLLLNLECRGQGLGQGGGIVGDVIGHPMEIADRQEQPLGKGPVAVDDAEDGAPRAVSGGAGAAGRAGAAGGIDLADDSGSAELFRTLFDETDELVAEDASVRIVPVDELQVRVADTRLEDPDEGFPGRGSR